MTAASWRAPTSIKAFGIPMGEPAYKLKILIEKLNVAVFSSNYTLYGDMSRRVMSFLTGFSPDAEVYSVDEVFLSLDGFDSYDLPSYCAHIRQDLPQHFDSRIVEHPVATSSTIELVKYANQLFKQM